MKILVIAPHPDDEVLGCGGTIASHVKNGDDVHLCVATVAYAPDWSESLIKKREKETEKSAKILGIKKIHKLNFPTAKLDTIGQKEINDSLKNLINKIKPEVVYIPHQYDLHKDHRIIFESSLVAARPSFGKNIRALLSYETLSETEFGREIGYFNPNVYSDITGTIDKKVKAIKSYVGELKKHPHPRSLVGIKSLATLRGSESGVKYAEAFHLIRGINIFLKY